MECLNVFWWGGFVEYNAVPHVSDHSSPFFLPSPFVGSHGLQCSHQVTWAAPGGVVFEEILCRKQSLTEEFSSHPRLPRNALWSLADIVAFVAFPSHPPLMIQR